MRKEIDKIEQERMSNQTRKFYRSAKGFVKGYQARRTGCKDKNGKLLIEKDQILNRWKQHFQETLTANMEEGVEVTREFLTAEVELTEPTLQEVEDIIGKMKNNKAPGTDEITTELIKYGGKKLIQAIHMLMGKIWREERIPEEWSKSLICPIWKKGDKMDCNNYRGIMLLNVGYKIFTCILHKRMNLYAE